MFGLNKVTLIGNVGRTPEVNTTKDNKDIVHFTLATTESWKDRATGEKKDHTEWHRIVVFSEALGNIVKSYVKKGSKIYVEGQLRTKKWVDGNGQEKYSTDVVIQNYQGGIILLDSKGQGGSVSAVSASTKGKTPDNSSNYNNASNFDHSELDDEIPF